MRRAFRRTGRRPRLGPEFRAERQTRECGLKSMSAEPAGRLEPIGRVDDRRAGSGASVRWALASLSLSMLLSSLGTSVASAALPTLAQAFGASFQAVQWIVLAYLLAITTLVVGAGRLGDLVGRRRLLLAGLALFTAASAVCAIAPTLPLLIAARALQGIGAAVMMALTMALVGDAVPKAQTGRAMGLLGTMSAVGTALGPTLGGLLIAVLGWQALFLVNVPLGLLALGLAWRGLPVDRPRPHASARAGLDPAGTLLMGLALAGYALALTLGRGDFGALNLAWLAAAVVAAGLFVRTESRAASPLIQLALLRNRPFRASLAMNAIASTVVMATLVVGPFHLSGALGLGAAAVGLVMSAGPVVSALAGLPAGQLVDRWGERPTAIGGLAGMVLGCAALAALPANTALPWAVAGYVVPLVVLTAGYALFQAANNTAVMRDVAPDRRGVVSGLLGLSRNLGLVTGAALMGAVFAWASAGGSAVAAGGLRATFALATALLLAALALAWVVVGRKATDS
jgi:EmrB/QacA subfamily drug resistance transporter